jgi:putative ABC transport system permease protein
MNAVTLALAYARRRPLATLLNVLLLAVGVATIALVLLLARDFETRLTRDAEGIDLVVGAKGSPLQLILAGVYHADVPPGNIPLAEVARLRANPLVAEVLPLALGDSARGFRIAGVEPAFIAHYRAQLSAGTLWDEPMEAVLGAEVARATGLAVGSTFTGSHGLGEAGAEHGGAPYRVVGVLAATGRAIDRLALTAIESVWTVHDAHGHATADATATGGAAAADPHPTQGVPAKGAPGTGAKDGRAAGHDHHAGHGHDATAAADAAVAADDPHREVTLALVRYRSPLAAASLPRAINTETPLQAASPAYESARLLTVFAFAADILRAFALLLMAASALGLFVALAQALDERRYDLAIMRALGASRGQVVAVILIESLLLAAAGLAVGLLAANIVVASIGAWIPAAAPLAAAAWTWPPAAWALVALALGAGILSAAWPAWRAYRLDVAATLADA